MSQAFKEEFKMNSDVAKQSEKHDALDSLTETIEGIASRVVETVKQTLNDEDLNLGKFGNQVVATVSRHPVPYVIAAFAGGFFLAKVMKPKSL